MKLLIVEDSERLRRSLREGLCRSGFTVDVAADGHEGLAFAELYEYDVIVLDLMLPGLDGLSLLAKLRRGGNGARVLILSAKDQIDDRVRGLDVGADDYLVKPFSFEELVARIRALNRRPHEIAGPEITVGGITLDTARRRVCRDGAEIAMTPTEYRLLEYMALRRGRVLSKETLRDRLYDSAAETESNTIEAIVSNVRRKLRAVGAGEVIRTRRGFGYLVE